jgi:hypothetical protein
VPASAVIPALIVYNKIVVVKTLVVNPRVECILSMKPFQIVDHFNGLLFGLHGSLRIKALFSA